MLPLPPPSPRAQRPLIAVSSGERGRESLRPRHQQPLLLTVASYNVLVRPRWIYKQTPCLGFECFSLCLSRACLGRLLSFSINGCQS